MRTLLLIPISIALTAAAGYGACAVASADPHVLEMSLACGAIILASAAGVVPLILSRHANQLGLSQAALIGTAAHLFVAISLGAVALLGKFRLNQSFLWWLLAFYWMSLMALAVVFARAVRNAPPAPAVTAPKT